MTKHTHYLLYFFFLLLGYILFAFQDYSQTKEDNNILFLLLAFFVVPILRLLFPRLRKIGFGTHAFFPYLINLFRKK